MNPLDIQYFQLEEKHLKDAKWLFEKVYNKKVSVEYLKKKYDGSYLGVGSLGFIAYYQGKPVSLFGAIAQKFKYKGRDILGVHSCDLFTLQEFQGKGLHYQMGIRNAELAKSLGFSFLYGFHNKNTLPVKTKLGWSTHKRLSRFHIKINSLPLAKIFLKLKSESIYQFICAVLLKRYEAKSSLGYQTKNAGQVYDDNFFQYKNRISPHYCIELNGCRFFFKIDAIIKVGVFSYSDISQFKLAIKKFKQLAFFLGVVEMEFHVYENTDMYKALKSIAAPYQSWLIGICPIEDLDFDEFEFNLADFDTF